MLSTSVAARLSAPGGSPTLHGTVRRSNGPGYGRRQAGNVPKRQLETP
jgi:hypothetical protein